MLVFPFPWVFSSKVNVITQLEFELASNEDAVQRVNHYTTETPNFIYMLILKVVW